MDDCTRIYLVDDHKIVRDGIKSLLIGNRNIRVTGEAKNGNELLSMLGKEQPHIVVLDIGLPDISGVELTRIISRDFPAVKVITLTAEMEEEIILATIRNGASGFLNKDISADEFEEAVKRVSEGEGYFGQRVSGIIYKSYIRKVNSRDAELSNGGLSDREKEIVVLLSEGLSFREIGDRLCISPRTVENHKSRILEKLELNSTIDLVKYAIRNKLISL